MATATATIEWQRGDAVFTDNRYSRAHQWVFDGGVTVPASSSPEIVRPPLSDPSAVDPEEAFVASLSSCHMLWFLHLARDGGFVVERYRDEAVGELGKDANGNVAMTVVTLRPRVLFGSERLPTEAEIDQLHHRAHDACFIANSVKTEVRCVPAVDVG